MWHNCDISVCVWVFVSLVSSVHWRKVEDHLLCMYIWRWGLDPDLWSSLDPQTCRCLDIRGEGLGKVDQQSVFGKSQLSWWLDHRCLNKQVKPASVLFCQLLRLKAEQGCMRSPLWDLLQPHGRCYCCCCCWLTLQQCALDESIVLTFVLHRWQRAWRSTGLLHLCVCQPSPCTTTYVHLHNKVLLMLHSEKYLFKMLVQCWWSF